MKIDNSMCLGESLFDDSVIPWPGLASYDDPEKSNIKKCFYGRDDESYDIFKLIESNHFVTLYGKSGIGKTSLLKAGVFPDLRRKNYLPVYLRLGMKDKTQSFQELIIKSIEDLVYNIKTINVIDEQQDQNKPNHLWNYFARHRFFDKDGESLIPVIVLDQFEELLRHNRAETEFLLRQIDYAQDRNHILDNEIIDGELYRYQQNFRFVVSIREDYLYQLEDSIDTCYLPVLKCCRYRLLPLYDDQAEDIIRKPILGLISREVAEEIISKVANCPISNFRLGDGERQIEVDAAMLSLFMHELFRLYINNKIDTEIPLSLVKEVGDNIIKTFYQDRMSKISSSTVNYLEDHLVTDEGIRNCIFEYQALQDGIEEWELKFLQDQRIIHKINWYDSKDRIEFMHDRLCPIIKDFKEQRKSEEQLKAYELEQQQLKDEKEVERTKRNIEYNKRKRATDRNVLLHKGRRLIDNALDFGEYRTLSDMSSQISMDRFINFSRIMSNAYEDYFEDATDSEFVNQQVFSDPLLNDSICALSFYKEDESTPTIDGIYGVELKYNGTLISDIFFKGKKVAPDGSMSFDEPIFILGGYCGIHIDYDENKREIQRIYLDDSGNPITTLDGYSVIQTKYDEKDNPVKIRYYNLMDGDLLPIRHIHGNHGYDSVFDKNGNEIARHFVDENEQPTSIVSGVYGKRITYDKDSFRQVTISNIDTNGELMADKDGYVTVQILYDKNGLPTINLFLDENGKPWRRPDGTYGEINNIDFSQNIIEVYYVDENGTYIKNNDGAFKTVIKVNEKRQITEFYSKDKNDQIIESEDNQNIQLWSFDEQNRLQSIKFLNKDRLFISGLRFDCNREGTHITRAFCLSENGIGVYENLGVEGIEYSLNDGNNLPVLQIFINEYKQFKTCNDGYHAVRKWEDDKGRIIKELYYDVDGTPMPDNSGVFGIKLEYLDEETTKRIYLDADENIIENKNGVAFTVEVRNSLGSFQINYNIKEEPYEKDGWVYINQERIKTNYGYQERRFVLNSNKEQIEIFQHHRADAGWGIVPCMFVETNFDYKGRPLSEYFKDFNGNIVGDADGDSYTIWEYDDSINQEILSLYNIKDELRVRIKTIKDNKNRITEQSYFNNNNEYLELERGYSGEIYKYDDDDNKKIVSFIDSKGEVCNNKDGFAHRIYWYDSIGRLIAQKDETIDGNVHGLIGFREFIDSEKRECAYYIHHEDDQGHIIPNENGSVFEYFEEDNKGRTIKNLYLNAEKLPFPDTYGDYGLNYEYDDEKRLKMTICLDESGQPHNNKLGFGIVHSYMNEDGKEIKRMYYKIDGTPITLSSLLGCYGLSYKYPNEHNKIVGYLDEDGEITTNIHKYAYREECVDKGTETEIRKVFYYDKFQNNIQSKEDDNNDYGFAIINDGNSRIFISLDKNGDVTNNACGYAVRAELIEDGRLRSYKYETCEGKPIPDSKGDYGVEFQYSDDGSVIRRVSLNAKYEPHVNDFGYCICDEITDISGDKVYIWRDMNYNQVLPKLRFVHKIKNMISKLTRIEKTKPIFNCRQMGAIFNCVLWNFGSKRLKKYGLNGTYVLLGYEDWQFGDDYDKFNELLSNTEKTSKHTILLPVSLNGSLLQQVGDIVEVDFPAGKIDMRFADWGINEETIRAIVEKIEKQKNNEEHNHL